MRTGNSLPIAIVMGVGLLTYIGLTACGQTPPKATDKTAKTAADEAAIMETAKAYEKAFNAADAKAIADEYITDGEMMNSDGDVFTGRVAIEKEMAAYFKEIKGAKIKIDVDSIRMLGADMALEDGSATTSPPNDAPVTVGKYTAVHVKRDGKWKLASTRSMETENASPHEHLKQLDWLIGDWVDESPDATVRHHCAWSEDGNYLLVDFDAQFAGHRHVKGTQRIGWDPLYKQLKSWVFDSAGGFAEGHWTYTGSAWIVKVTGVRPDGAVATATNSYAPIDKDRFNWSSTGRVVGGEEESDITILIVRKPPAAAPAT